MQAEAKSSTLRPMRRDPVELEIFKNLYHSIAEEMGAALRRTAFSPNIKERRDYSCAVFDGTGEVIAMGDHMPVHLGSMPMSVRAAIDAGAKSSRAAVWGRTLKSAPRWMPSTWAERDTTGHASVRSSRRSFQFDPLPDPPRRLTKEKHGSLDWKGRDRHR